MKIPGQHLRLLAFPAAIAFAFVGCDKGAGSEKAASKPGSSATVKAGDSGEETASATSPVVASNGLSAAVAGDFSKAPNKVSAATPANGRVLQGASSAGAAEKAQDNIVISPKQLELGQMQPGVPKTGIVTLDAKHSIQVLVSARWV